MILPVVDQLVAGFLPHHPLLNPLLAAPVLPPVFPGAVEGTGRITHVLDALVADFGQPELDRLGLGAGNRLDNAQQGLGIGHIGEAGFAIGGGHFRLVTICHQLTFLLLEALLELVPILTRSLVIRLLNQRRDNIHHRKIPGFRRLVLCPANLEVLENGKGVFIAHGRPPVLSAK